MFSAESLHLYFVYIAWGLIFWTILEAIYRGFQEDKWFQFAANIALGGVALYTYKNVDLDAIFTMLNAKFASAIDSYSESTAAALLAVLRDGTAPSLASIQGILIAVGIVILLGCIVKGKVFRPRLM